MDDTTRPDTGPEEEQRASAAAEAADGAPRPDSVATGAENAKLEHTAGGVTTRDDALDAGVPMLQGQPDEPIGPEDALGPGAKRGDYSGRLVAGPHMVTEVIPESEREVIELTDEDGNVIGLEKGPNVRLVDADARASEIGDEPGKGGVSTPTAREHSEAEAKAAREAVAART